MATEEQKKKMIQKRLNPGSNSSPEDDPKKRPRVSIYWIYGIIFAAIIGYNLYKNTNGGGGVEIANTQFYAMLKQGDVNQIKTVGNKKLVRVFIDPKALQNNVPFYSNVFGNDYEAVKTMKPPQAWFSIIKDDTFARDIADF